MNRSLMQQRRNVPVNRRTAGHRRIDARRWAHPPTDPSSLLVLLDIGPSGMSETDLLRKLRESFPNVQVLAVDGGNRLTPNSRRRKEPMDGSLTPHQSRVLKLLVEGHTYRTAAAELGVTPYTIDFHLRSVYGKLQVHSKAEAITKALRDRLVR